MLVSYAVAGRAPGGQPIHGHVMIRSTPQVDGAIRYTVAASQVACGELVMIGGEDVGFIRIPTDGGAGMLTSGGIWQLGAWVSDATGVWFVAADGTRLAATVAAYGELPARIDLDAANVTAGPFQPEGILRLTAARPAASTEVRPRDEPAS